MATTKNHHASGRYGVPLAPFLTLEAAAIRSNAFRRVLILAPVFGTTMRIPFGAPGDIHSMHPGKLVLAEAKVR